MEILDIHSSTERSIYEYFGCLEEQGVLPISDDREYQWTLSDDSVFFWEADALKDGKLETWYDSYILTRSNGSQRVYRREDCTAIANDTQTGYTPLSIFSNSKELKNPSLDLMRDLHGDDEWEPKLNNQHKVRQSAIAQFLK